jgi:Protein of unknown function (DUF1393).
MYNTTKKIAISAILLAADVLLTRVAAINTPVMKIGLGFAAVAICGALYGPMWTALVAALGDLFGSILFPTGAYFPGFTLTAALTGLVFGICLHGKKISFLRALVTAALNVLLISYLANSGMIAYLTGATYQSMLATRAVQLLVMLPVQTIVLTAIGASKIMDKKIKEEQEK